MNELEKLIETHTNEFFAGMHMNPSVVEYGDLKRRFYAIAAAAIRKGTPE